MIKIVKKIKKYISNKSKFCFYTPDNIVFIISACLSVVFIVISYFFEDGRIHNIIVAICTAILSAVLIPLGLNCGKYLRERKEISESVKSIADLSVVLFYDLNEFLTLNGKETIDGFLNTENDKYIETLDLILKERNFIVFNIILKKVSHIVDMKYLTPSDAFVVVFEEIVSTQEKDKNFTQMYLDLIRLLRCIKSLFKNQKYLDDLNSKIKESAKNLREKNIHYYDDYIVQCLENDLAEKQSYYARGEYT